MSGIKVDITGLSDTSLEVSVFINKLSIDFNKEHLSIEARVVKKSNDPRIGEVVRTVQITASNKDRVLVKNSDGTNSIVPVLDGDGNQIYQITTPAAPILQDKLDEQGNPLTDSEGNVIQELTGYTSEVTEVLTEQETIGEFEFWKRVYSSLISDLENSILRNLDPTVNNDFYYTKPS